jgi:K+-transporting ATPase A subunit
MSDVQRNPDSVTAGRVVVRANVVLTAVFMVTSLVAAVSFRQPWKTVSVAVDIVCFAIGIFAFLWGYWNAVQRSREEDIGVAALYFLMDGIAPRSVSVRMNALLGTQLVWAIATALSRGSTDGKPGSTLAFGVLVPMLGLGLNGLWGAFHGTFAPRGTGKQGTVSQSGDGNGQD